MKKIIILLLVIIYTAVQFCALPSLALSSDFKVEEISYVIDGEEILSDNFYNGMVSAGADNVNLYLSASAEVGEVRLYYYAFEKKVLLPASVKINGKKITVTPLNSFKEGARHKIEYKIGNEIFEAEFNVSESYDHLLYYHNNFDKETRLKISANGAEILRENSRMLFGIPDSTAASGYADIVASSVTNADEYVIEAEVLIEKLTGSAYLKLFDGKNEKNGWRLGAKVSSDGKIRMNDTAIVGTWSKNVPFVYSAKYNTESGFCSVYINGKLTAENIYVGTLKPTIFRIDIYNNGGSAKAYIDKLRIYEGNKLLPTDAFCNNDYLESEMDRSKQVKKVLDGVRMFTEGEYYYADNQKKNYISDIQKPIMHNGKMYVSQEFISDILLINTYNIERENINGKMMVPASSLGNLTGLYYLEDARGFFVLSKEEFQHKNSDDFTQLFEISDLIYREIMFQNPDGEEIFSDFSAKSEGVHPRILYSAEDISFVKNKITQDALWQHAFEGAVSAANSALKYDGKFTANCPDSEKQSQAVAFQDAIEKLATAYIFTENTVYADKAIEYMKKLCSWESIGYEKSNLTIGHWAMGVAIGYDTFYNYMSLTQSGKEDLNFIKNAAKRLIFTDTINAYNFKKGPHWIRIRDNFQGVISGGVMSLLLSMADGESENFDYIYLFENVIKSMEIAVSLFGRNGGYFEGVNYSRYCLENFTGAISALFNCCGSDYGLGNAKGFTEAGSFFPYMQTTEYQFNFSDCNAGVINTQLPTFFARYYGKCEGLELSLIQKNIRNVEYGVKGLLNVSRARELYGETDTNGLPLDKYFDYAEVGSFRNSFKAETPTFVGFHGGRTGLTHDMLDSGQFVFESDGVLWAADLGKDDYSLPAYFNEDGYKIYRKRPEGENCVVINPSKDSQTYFGQAIGESATLEFFESNENSAMAAFDLTDVYARDVSDYTRGYYFGDNRNTLTVQDEISLKESSELYWFMHTSASIEVVNQNTAILTKGNKQLRAEVYCSDENYQLLSMAAEPLPSSPQVLGQATNAGYRKLAVHFENISGDILLAVKLIPLNGFYDAKMLTPTPIMSWTLEDTEDMTPVFKNAHINALGMFSADVLLPESCRKAVIYLDGKEVTDISDVERGLPLSIKPVNTWDVRDGYHYAKMEIQLNNGETLMLQEKFKVSLYKEETILSGLPIAPNISKSENNFKFSVVTNGNEVVNTLESGYILSKNDNDYMRIQTYPNDGFFVNSGGLLYEMSFYAMNEDISLGFYAKNGNNFCIGETFLENGKLGRMFFENNEKINIKAYLDTDNNKYFLAINDIVFKYGRADRDLNNITSVFVEIHQNSPILSQIKKEDIKLSSYKKGAENVNISFYKSGNILNLDASLNDSVAFCESTKIFVCQYNAEKSLVGLKIYNISEENKSISKEIMLSESAEYVMAFACNADDLFEVFTVSDIFEIN